MSEGYTELVFKMSSIMAVILAAKSVCTLKVELRSETEVYYYAFSELKCCFNAVHWLGLGLVIGMFTKMLARVARI